ncbi:MAG: rhodanese-like domain-containing protein [Steroidobacteraceae bacterium]
MTSSGPYRRWPELADQRALSGRLHELETLKDKSIVLVCLTDKRSANAAALLREARSRDVRVLRGGMVSWKEHGLPVDDRTEVDPHS